MLFWKPPDRQEVFFNYSFTKFVFNFQFKKSLIKYVFFSSFKKNIIIIITFIIIIVIIIIIIISFPSDFTLVITVFLKVFLT